MGPGDDMMRSRGGGKRLNAIVTALGAGASAAVGRAAYLARCSRYPG